MIIMFLEATATFFTQLLGNVWSGSVMPGVDLAAGLLGSVANIS